jgi:hypothetical protein
MKFDKQINVKLLLPKAIIPSSDRSLKVSFLAGYGRSYSGAAAFSSRVVKLARFALLTFLPCEELLPEMESVLSLLLASPSILC